MEVGIQGKNRSIHQVPRQGPPRAGSHLSVYQSSSSSLFAMAFFLANNASAKLPARLGVGVLLLLPSDPFKLMPESRACSAAGFFPAAGRLAGGCGAAGLAFAAPFTAGGGGGGRGAATGAGACSSTYEAGTHASRSSVFASHQPRCRLISTAKYLICRGMGGLSAYHYSLSGRFQ